MAEVEKKRRDVEIMLQRLEVKNQQISADSDENDEDVLPPLPRSPSKLINADELLIAAKEKEKQRKDLDFLLQRLKKKREAEKTQGGQSRKSSLSDSTLVRRTSRGKNSESQLLNGKSQLTKSAVNDYGASDDEPSPRFRSQSQLVRRKSSLYISRASVGSITALPPTSQLKWQSSLKLLTTMQKGARAIRRQQSVRALTSPKEKNATDVQALTDTRREQMLKKFRHAARMILILKKWSFEIARSIDANRLLGKYTTFTDLAVEASEQAVPSDAANDLGFDVNYYKAKKELTLSSEVKDILALPPKLRTNEQIMTVIYGIRNHPSFAEYPHHMQEKLCQVARYEMVPAQRVIIRQGHFGQNFYFIISGQVIVKVMETHPLSGEETVRTAAILKDGSSFGEIALLHHVRRTATVVSRDVIHLLTIGREDFFDIFMGEFNDTSGDPVHIKFLTSMAFMKGWPIEKLIKHKDYCTMHYFRRGRVVVEDSKQSDWIYVVKSGSCRVLKHMKETIPERVWKKKIRVDRSKDLPRPGTSEQSPRVDDSWKKRNVSSRCSTRSPWMHSDTSSTLFKLTDPSETPSGEPGQVVASGASLRRLDRSETVQHLPPIVAPTDYASIPGLVASPRCATSRDNLARGGSDATSAKNMGAGFSESRLDVLLPGRRGAESPAKSLTVSFAKESSFLEDSRLSDYHRQERVNSSASRNAKGVDFYLQVHILTSGDTFGLADLQFDDDVETSGPSMSLVSQGAELIMLKKQFFINYADEEVKEHLRQNRQEYPSENTIRNNLKIKLNWDTYRGTVMRNVLDKQQDLHALRQKTVVTGL